METRTKGKIVTGGFYTRNWFYGTSWSPLIPLRDFDSTGYYFHNIQKISSYYGPYSKGSWHECVHAKAEVFGLSGQTLRSGTDEYLYTGCPVKLRSCTYSGSTWVTPEAWNNALDTLDLGQATKVSLPNFLLDLAEMRTLFRNFGGGHRTRMPKNLRNEGGFLSKSGALWLMYSYGIKPFIGDLSAILQCSKLAHEKASRMASNAGKRQKRRIHVPVESNIMANPIFRLDDSVAFADTEWVDNTPTHTKGTLFVDYTPSLYVPSPHEIAMQYLGLRDIGSVVWDAIPFSFVADWFVDTQRFVRQFNADMITFPAALGPCGSQTKSVKEFTLKLSSTPLWVDPSPKTVTIRCSVFIRGSGLPVVSDGSLATNRFHARQMSYAAALVSNILKL